MNAGLDSAQNSMNIHYLNKAATKAAAVFRCYNITLIQQGLACPSCFVSHLHCQPHYQITVTTLWKSPGFFMRITFKINLPFQYFNMDHIKTLETVPLTAST